MGSGKIKASTRFREWERRDRREEIFAIFSLETSGSEL